jgi:hypothetical protein
MMHAPPIPKRRSLMAVEWTEARQSVIDLAERLIDKHHPHLKDARLAIIMRSEAPVSGGLVTYGKARKVSAEQQVHIPYDFIIWLALDRWDSFLSPLQREALLDHELSHCQWDGFTASIRGHDVEEFNHIIERYGFWWPQSDTFAVAVQQALPIPKEREGGVGTISFNKMVGDMLDEVAKGMNSMNAEGVEVTVHRRAGE